METELEYKQRRIKHTENRIEMIEDYLKSNSTSKCKEIGVGRGHIRRRNRQLSGLQQTRVSEFKSELQTLKKTLIEVKQLPE